MNVKIYRKQERQGQRSTTDMPVCTGISDTHTNAYITWRGTHTNTYITWRGRLSMRERIPNSTNRRLVRVKALMALVTFWIFLSRLGPDGTLLAVEEKKRHGAS